MADIYQHACEVELARCRDGFVILTTHANPTALLLCEDRATLARSLRAHGWRPTGGGRWYRNQTGYGADKAAPGVEVLT